MPPVPDEPRPPEWDLGELVPDQSRLVATMALCALLVAAEAERDLHVAELAMPDRDAHAVLAMLRCLSAQPDGPLGEVEAYAATYPHREGWTSVVVLVHAEE